MTSRSQPVHPGTILYEQAMKPLGVSRNKLARDIDVPVGRISDIVAGKRGVTPDTALRLGKYFGTTAELWMKLQIDYDLHVARTTVWAEIEPRVRELQHGEIDPELMAEDDHLAEPEPEPEPEEAEKPAAAEAEAEEAAAPEPDAEEEEESPESAPAEAEAEVPEPAPAAPPARPATPPAPPTRTLRLKPAPSRRLAVTPAAAPAPPARRLSVKLTPADPRAAAPPSMPDPAAGVGGFSPSKWPARLSAGLEIEPPVMPAMPPVPEPEAASPEPETESETTEGQALPPRPEEAVEELEIPDPDEWERRYSVPKVG